MSNVKTNISDYLTQIETLTNTNLQILKTINDSFFTKKNHLFAEIDDTTYVIPSFLSLENKINMLQENFENLVKAPENNEAYFNFDGNTRAIEVRKYSHVPDSLTLPTVSTYSVESNDIFKDFLTPVPYINLELPTLPNDIVEVNVKKIIAKSDNLKALFKNKLSYTVESIDKDGNTIIETRYHQSTNEAYGNMYKLLLNYTEDVDYIEYESVYKVPIRKNIGTGTYIIESVVSDNIDEDLNEIITLKIRDNNKLTYKLFDDTIEKPLKIGDELINFDGTGKVVITDIRTATNTIVVRVVNGEYLNFVGTDNYDTNNDSDIHDLSKLRFYADIDFNSDKNIKIPLEEDQYVYIAIAAINSRMNVQSSWGNGIIVNTYSLKDDNKYFNTYYKENVKNIGDVLLEMSNMITSPITSLSQETFDKLTAFKPILDKKSLSVMMINKHLNNSDTVKNIRNAYNQKKIEENKLSEIQDKINTLNDKLSTISFNDTTGIRNTYTAQLSQLTKQKNDILANITNAINTISLNVNSAEIPIENAKFRIRGFYTPGLDIIDDITLKQHIIGLQVQYRYKNISTEIGNAVSINGLNNNETYIYSDWNVFDTKNKLKIASCTDGVYSYAYEADNENKNEPSYNQLDIPISQGETVDIRLKVVYDFGQPYITMMSDWSDIINIEFPEEYTKDIPVLTIIEENNNDIETNRFNNLLETSGVINHINDIVVDNNITYYHKPDNIASGFYTEERRVIPLKDKLESIVNDIALIKSDVLGTTNNLRVSISIGNTDTELYSDRDNIITLEPYSNFNNDTVTDGAYEFSLNNTVTSNTVKVTLNLTLSNVGDSVIKLYSLFPGNRGKKINDVKTYLYDPKNYIDFEATNKDRNGGVYINYRTDIALTNNISLTNASSVQSLNQFITFRTNNPWDGEKYYTSEGNAGTNKIQTSISLPYLTKDAAEKSSMILYPLLLTEFGLCLNSDNIQDYLVINPGSEVIIPLYCEYIITKANEQISKMMSFDLRTSLYKDPINYTFKVVAKNKNSVKDYLQIKNKKRLWDRLVSSLKYNQTVK